LKQENAVVEIGLYYASRSMNESAMVVAFLKLFNIISHLALSQSLSELS
jgi:hypothetical protein